MYAGSFAILIVSRILMSKNVFVYVLICLLIFKALLMGSQKLFLLHLLKYLKASKLGGSVDRSGYLVVTLALNGGASFLIIIWKVVLAF